MNTARILTGLRAVPLRYWLIAALNDLGRASFWLTQTVIASYIMRRIFFGH